jgi:hypothetical protein
MSAQIHALAILPPGRESPTYLLDRGVGGPRNMSGRRVEERKPSPYRDWSSEPSGVEPVASRCTDCAIPALMNRIEGRVNQIIGRTRTEKMEKIQLKGSSSPYESNWASPTGGRRPLPFKRDLMGLSLSIGIPTLFDVLEPHNDIFSTRDISVIPIWFDILDSCVGVYFRSGTSDISAWLDFHFLHTRCNGRTDLTRSLQRSCVMSSAIDIMIAILRLCRQR